MQQINRCPECGNRLTTNYCPICLKRVSFLPQAGDDASSSHREEGHTCVSFEVPAKKIKRPGVASAPLSTGRSTRNKSKPRSLIVMLTIMLVLFCVIGTLFGVVGSVLEESLEPEYNYEAFIPAGEAGAEALADILPTEIYNANDIVITVNGAGDYYGDYAIAMTIDNRSGQDITVSSDLPSVNGYMLQSAILYETVDAGITRQLYLQLSSYDLEHSGIGQIAQLQFYLDIYDANDYTMIDRTGLICLQTQIAETYVQPVDDSGVELYHDGGVRIVAKYGELSSYGDYTVTLFVENDTDHIVYLCDEALLLNGQEADGFLWIPLHPHARAIDELYLSNVDELGIYDLSQISDVTIELLIEHLENRSIIETISSTLTLSPGQLEE